MVVESKHKTYKNKATITTDTNKPKSFVKQENTPLPTNRNKFFLITGTCNLPPT